MTLNEWLVVAGLAGSLLNAVLMLSIKAAVADLRADLGRELAATERRFYDRLLTTGVRP